MRIESGASDTPLFRRLLGPDFDRLPPAVRALHAATLPHRFEGEVRVDVPRRLAARMLGRLLGFPQRSFEAAAAVTIEADGCGERWTRHFPPRPMRTRLQPQGALLWERFGPLRIGFRLFGDPTGITWVASRARLFGLPLPRACLAGIRAQASERDGRYAFSVCGSLPGVGMLLRYQGWLAEATVPGALGPGSSGRR